METNDKNKSYFYWWILASLGLGFVLTCIAKETKTTFLNDFYKPTYLSLLVSCTAISFTVYTLFSNRMIEFGKEKKKDFAPIQKCIKNAFREQLVCISLSLIFLLFYNSDLFKGSLLLLFILNTLFIKYIQTVIDFGCSVINLNSIMLIENAKKKNNNMIPKVIHYCWFGRNPLPESAKKCIESWQKYMPDYEVKEWNEDNFDVNIIPYTAEAYRMKKYAFVSDYARFWILYKYGGIYLDVDVEIIKPMHTIVEQGAYLGCEYLQENRLIGNLSFGINPGLGMGFPKAHTFLKTILDYYAKKHLCNIFGGLTDTVVTIVTRIISDGIRNNDINNASIAKYEDINIFPPEYLSPLNAYTKELKVTDNTFSIHHYCASWTGNKSVVEKALKRLSFISTRISVTLGI